MIISPTEGENESNVPVLFMDEYEEDGPKAVSVKASFRAKRDRSIQTKFAHLNSLETIFLSRCGRNYMSGEEPFGFSLSVVFLSQWSVRH